MILPQVVVLTLYQMTNFGKKKLVCSTFKAFADDKINVILKLRFVLGKVEKHCEKRRKCWLPAFSPFPSMFSKGFFFKVVW